MYGTSSAFQTAVRAETRQIASKIKILTDKADSTNLLTQTHTGAGYEDLTIEGTPRLQAKASAKGKGQINVYQADGEQTRVYTAAIDSVDFSQVETGDAVVAGRNIISDSDIPIDFTDNKFRWSDFGNMTWREVLE